jgi:hypothetical protein
MKKPALPFCLAAALAAAPAFATFDSGSSGADGAFNPTATTAVQLPPDGILQYTDVNIPAGVTVTFKKNAANTPAVILASGDITIAGTLSVSASAASGQTAGAGGPGGYDGGKGGPMFSPGGPGKGPGGGNGGVGTSSNGYICAGGGGGYGGQGGNANSAYGCNTTGGAVYGSAVLVPLIGGSGGGGGAGTSTMVGGGGGGGGGALLLAATGKITVSGTISADGGSGTYTYLSGIASYSGGGSGGAIRLIATTIDGNGKINANGAAGSGYGGAGGAGRIRLEAENLLRTTQSTPTFSFSTPYEVFPALLPTLRFVSVAGVAAPAQPTGNMDVSLPADVGNPVSVELAGSGVPPGSSIKLVSAPESGAQSTATSTPLAGNEGDSRATAQINIADGKSTLIASVGFTVTAALGRELAPYAGGEQVAQVELTAGLQGRSSTKLITASGKEYLLPQARTVFAR